MEKACLAEKWGTVILRIKERKKKLNLFLLSPKLTNLTCQMQVQLVDNPLATDSRHGNCWSRVGTEAIKTREPISRLLFF